MSVSLMMEMTKTILDVGRISCNKKLLLISIFVKVLYKLSCYTSHTPLMINQPLTSKKPCWGLGDKINEILLSITSFVVTLRELALLEIASYF